MSDATELKRKINIIKDNIDRSEEYLKFKKKEFDKNPASLFAQGAFKNASEYIEELKADLEYYEKQLKGK